MKIGENEANNALEKLKLENSKYCNTIKSLRDKIMALNGQIESGQEMISNTLLREVERLKDEKIKWCKEAEKETEKIITCLERKLQNIRHEKVQLEVQLEQEQERIVNKLSKRISDLNDIDGNGDGGFRIIESHNDIHAHTLIAKHREREAILKNQIQKLQDENQKLLIENVRLQRSVRRSSIEGENSKNVIGLALANHRRSSFDATLANNTTSPSTTLTPLQNNNSNKNEC